VTLDCAPAVPASIMPAPMPTSDTLQMFFNCVAFTPVSGFLSRHGLFFCSHACVAPRFARIRVLSGAEAVELAAERRPSGHRIDSA
jgi:hypothetical protein